MKNLTAMYVVIRKALDDGREWVDHSSLSLVREQTQTLADKLDHEIPQWAKVNKQVRVISCTLTVEL
jgi:hypothetical protein